MGHGKDLAMWSTLAHSGGPTRACGPAAGREGSRKVGRTLTPQFTHPCFTPPRLVGTARPSWMTPCPIISEHLMPGRGGGGGVTVPSSGRPAELTDDLGLHQNLICMLNGMPVSAMTVTRTQRSTRRWSPIPRKNTTTPLLSQPTPVVSFTQCYGLGVEHPRPKVSWGWEGDWIISVGSSTLSSPLKVLLGGGTLQGH